MLSVARAAAENARSGTRIAVSLFMMPICAEYRNACHMFQRKPVSTKVCDGSLISFRFGPIRCRTAHQFGFVSAQNHPLTPHFWVRFRVFSSKEPIFNFS